MRWFFDLLYGSAPAEFESRFGLEESVRRLSAATRRFVFLITKQVAIGHVSKDRVSLRRAFSFGTQFFGEFREDDGRVVLSGRFTLSWWLKALMTYWLGFCLLWTSLAAFAVLARDPHLWWFPLLGVAMFGVGVTVLWLAKRLSRNEIAWLSRMIQDSLSR